jgi:hypothetical protein
MTPSSVACVSIRRGTHEGSMKEVIFIEPSWNAGGMSGPTCQPQSVEPSPMVSRCEVLAGLLGAGAALGLAGCTRPGTEAGMMPRLDDVA